MNMRNMKITGVAGALILLVLSFPVFSQGRNPDREPGKPKGDRNEQNRPRYSVEQAVSDKAQLHTIAFNGLAFLTGTFGADTFLPPGKVADYFGFQYMRDIDAAEGGHNMNFLTYIANNVMEILSDEQMALFKELAAEQAPQYRELVLKRMPMIRAFRMNLEGDYPPGCTALSKEAVVSHTAGIFELDGILSYRRAEVYGEISRSLTESQKDALGILVFGDSSTWTPKTNGPGLRSLPHEEGVLVMTYASEFFSWYAGSETADVYFCPERHGTYFGGFYMKDYPAMGNADYFIPTELTGENGETFLNTILNEEQRALLLEIPELQKDEMEAILNIRKTVSLEFRSLFESDVLNKEKILVLSREYGEIDGALSWLYADRFARINLSLTGEQREKLMELRNQYIFPEGVYYYSSPGEIPELEGIEGFFIQE